VMDHFLMTTGLRNILLFLHTFWNRLKGFLFAGHFRARCGAFAACANFVLYK